MVSEEDNDSNDSEQIRRYLIENDPLVEGTSAVAVDKAKCKFQKRWGWKQKAALVSVISISVCVFIIVVFKINPFPVVTTIMIQMSLYGLNNFNLHLQLNFWTCVLHQCRRV